jgi:hypothetical protein
LLVIPTKAGIHSEFEIDSGLRRNDESGAMVTFMATCTCGQREPVSNIPMPARLAGWRGQHEYFRRAECTMLQTVTNASAEHCARRVLAGEGKHGGCVGFDLGQQAGNVEGIPGQLIVITDMTLGQVGQADAESGQQGKFLGCQQSRREPSLEQRAPEHVAGVGVVGPFLGGALACGGAAEYQAQAGAQHVGKNRAV